MRPPMVSMRSSLRKMTHYSLLTKSLSGEWSDSTGSGCYMSQKSERRALHCEEVNSLQTRVISLATQSGGV